MTIPAPTGLSCEYLTDPLGIDARTPRFTWKLRHPFRGAKPEAYRIIIGSSAAAVAAGLGDVWDSGKLISSKTALIPYAGPALRSRQRCFWRVCWWMGGKRSAFSRTAYFEMGLLEPADWSAYWIGARRPLFFRTKGTVLSGQYRGDYIQTEAIYLTKEFAADLRPRSARVYVCGLGFFEFLLNGRKVGDHVLDPAQTDYRKSALYTTFDITTLLKARNSAVIVLGNGRHIKNFGFGPPKAICQIEIEAENGDRTLVATDETWTAGPGPVGRNGLYLGEILDARETAGQPAESAVRVPGPPLRAQMLPPIRVTQTILPRSVDRSASNAVLFDFGQNFSGWVAVRARGRTGSQISIRHAELLNEDGTLNTSPNQGAEATDTLILKGCGVEAYEPRFTYHGFRYAEISGGAGFPDLRRVAGRVVHSDIKRAGAFRCADELVNRIHRHILWGQRSNLMSIPTDCPQRDERHGWLGDAHLSAEEAILNFDLAAFYTKFLNDIRDAQGQDGSLPDFVPEYVPGFRPADPAWGSAYISLTWLMYWYYGDAGVLTEHFCGLKKYVDFLSRNASAHIVRKLGKYGDWCSPGSIVPKHTPLELTSTWFYYHDTLILSKIAAALKRGGDAARYFALARRIKDAFNLAFLEKDQYRAIQTSPVEKNISQTSNALPLYLGLVPAAKKSAVAGSLVRSVVKNWDCHLDTGIIGTRYLLDVLSEIGRTDLAWNIVRQTSYPGWGYMIKEGATTLWERWEKNTGGGMNSHNHIMLGSVDAWFHKTLGGVRCAAPGWTKILFEPPDLPDLAFAKASYDTIRGKVEAHWERSATRFAIRIRVPVGAAAELRLPRLWENPVLLEGDRPIRPAERSGRIVLKISAGAYRFALEKKR